MYRKAHRRKASCLKMHFSKCLILSVITILTLHVEQCHSKHVSCIQKFRQSSKTGKSKQVIFECSDDGNYKPMQCEPQTGFCFCVDVLTGTFRRDTSFRIEQINEHDCSKINSEPISDAPGASIIPINFTLNDSTSKPSSPKEEVTQAEPSEVRPQRTGLKGPFGSASAVSSLKGVSPSLRNPNSYQICVQSDRESIRQALLRHIRDGDYHSRNRTITGMRRQAIDRAVSDRKFYELDRNRNDALDSGELTDLVRQAGSSSSSTLVRCAGSFHRYCDADKDGAVGRAELYGCLTQPQLPRNSVNNNNGNKSDNNRGRKQRKNPESVPDRYATTKRPRLPRNETKKRQRPRGEAFSERQHTATRASDPSMTMFDTASQTQQRRKNSDNNGFDCNIVAGSAKSMAMKCTAGGAYAPFQCKLDTCWCVSEITGKIIKQLPKNSTEAACYRPYKGCDRSQRAAFHQEIRTNMERRQMNCSRAFDSMDTDRDGYISQREWKPFKKSMRSQLGHEKRRCLKSELTFCDKDQDKLLSADEWSFCCEATFQASSSPGYDARSLSSTDDERKLERIFNEKKDLHRNGPPPFQTILKDD